jgi:VIT1/CCC1 family predicted Fe2+/Mn2+ transporter
MAERPEYGLGHYLRDIVNGALDGVITTLAVISGTFGAQLAPRVGLILGLANLLGDGISMGASNYLGLKSELVQAGKSCAIEKPLRHGFATLIAFMSFGSIPLLGYAVPQLVNIYTAAIVGSIVALVILGSVRAVYTRTSAVRNAGEVVAIGLSASGAAYLIGDLANRII